MAYKRKSYRRKARRGNRKRRTPRRLSKHMVRAIRAIAQQPVETKQFPSYIDLSTLFNVTGYVSGASHIARGNLFSEIPRFKDTATKTEISFIGNDIQVRGFKFKIHMYAGTVGATPDALFRWTVYKIPGYVAGNSNIPPTGQEFNQSYTLTPTWSTWNTQYATIVTQRTFRLNESTTDPGHLIRKFWVPMRKKVTASGEESTVSNTYMAQIKGMQYYWALEMFAPTLTDLRGNFLGTIDTTVYFKDA